VGKGATYRYGLGMVGMGSIASMARVVRRHRLVWTLIDVRAVGWFEGFVKACFGFNVKSLRSWRRWVGVKVNSNGFCLMKGFFYSNVAFVRLFLVMYAMSTEVRRQVLIYLT
jgi:hypothetical protein